MKKIHFLFFAIFIINIANAQQFNTTGSANAMSSPYCYQLTNTQAQGGAVWYIYKVDLTLTFDITFSVNFGTRPDIPFDGGTNCGGDGMSFILQPLNTTQVDIGGGVGFHGITPSVGVVMDNYSYNVTDPPYPHISINKNGDELHGTINESSLKSTISSLRTK